MQWWATDDCDDSGVATVGLADEMGADRFDPVAVEVDQVFGNDEAELRADGDACSVHQVAVYWAGRTHQMQ